MTLRPTALLSWWCLLGIAAAFTSPYVQPISSSSCLALSKDDETTRQQQQAGGFTTTKNLLQNAWQDLGDMFASFDDVMDDFFNKRMGNGEIFYGKRKFKPSGAVKGDYNGFGLTDKARIDQTREYKEFIMEEKKRREEEKRK